MISRELGVIHMALIDAIHAQHPILGMNDERPTGEQFAQWVRGEQGKQLGVSGVLDLSRLALDLKASMDAVANRDDAKLQRDADWAALDVVAALSAPQEPEEDVDDPFPPPTPENPGEPSEGPRCQHCALFIEPAAGKGRGWRHSGSGFLGCEPDHDKLAEP